MELVGTGRRYASVSYIGPGDVVGGAAAFLSTRSYTAAYATGSNPSLDTADNTTGAFSATINIKTNGNLDDAALAAQIAANKSHAGKMYDQTGNGNHGIQGTASAQPIGVNLSGPGSFPGAWSYLSLPGGDARWFDCGTGLQFGTFTWLVAFFAVTGLGELSLVGGPNGGDFTLHMTTTGQLRLLRQSVTELGNSGGNLLTNNTWYIVGVSYNSGTGAGAFYANGAAFGTFTNASSPTFSNLYWNNDASAAPAQGGMAEFIVYNSVLTPTQISNLYTQASA